MVVVPAVESFSLSHVAILDGKTMAEKARLYGARSASLDVDSDTYNNLADDEQISSWNWFNNATLTIETGYISFDTLSYLAGVAVTSTGNTSADSWNVSLWGQTSLTLPPVPVVVTTPAKTATGAIGYLSFVLYKVEFEPTHFDGPAYKNGLTASFTGLCSLSETDERGLTLTEPAFGRLVYSSLPIIISSDQIINNGNGTFTLTDNGNGTYTIDGSDVTDNGNGTYTVVGLVDNGDGTYTAIG